MKIDKILKEFSETYSNLVEEVLNDIYDSSKVLEKADLDKIKANSHKRTSGLKEALKDEFENTQADLIKQVKKLKEQSASFESLDTERRDLSSQELLKTKTFVMKYMGTLSEYEKEIYAISDLDSEQNNIKLILDNQVKKSIIATKSVVLNNKKDAFKEGISSIYDITKDYAIKLTSELLESEGIMTPREAAILKDEIDLIARSLARVKREIFETSEVNSVLAEALDKMGKSKELEFETATLNVIEESIQYLKREYPDQYENLPVNPEVAYEELSSSLQ